MTHTPGTEDVGVLVFPGDDGFVRLRVYKYVNGEATEMLNSIALPPEVARNLAFNLTKSSYECEDVA